MDPGDIPVQPQELDTNGGGSHCEGVSDDRFQEGYEMHVTMTNHDVNGSLGFFQRLFRLGADFPVLVVHQEEIEKEFHQPLGG